VLGPVGGPGFQFRLRLELVDEVVAGAAVEPGYLHSGLEKLAESLGYHQLPAVLERVTGPDPVAAGLAVVIVISFWQELTGTKPPISLVELQHIFVDHHIVRGQVRF